MNLSDISSEILTLIVNDGAVAVGAVVFLAALGVPLPSTFFVLASGAFVAQGVLDGFVTALVALVCVVLGDTCSYGIGRIFRGPVHRRFGQSAAWQRAEHFFTRHGGVAIYLTRCLLTPIAIPINFVAGSGDYSVQRFVMWVTAGELTWLLVYGTLGYVFGSQWEIVSDAISNFSGLLVGLVLAGAGVYGLIRWQRRAPPETV